MCGDPPPPPPTQYAGHTQAIRKPHAGPDGGSNPTALAPTDEQIHKQHIRKPVGNGLKKDTGAARQVPDSSQNIENFLTGRLKVLQEEVRGKCSQHNPDRVNGKCSPQHNTGRLNGKCRTQHNKSG